MQVNVWDMLQLVTPVLLSVIGWGIRLVWSEIRALRNEQKEFVRERVCEMHRQAIQKQIDVLKAKGSA